MKVNKNSAPNSAYFPCKIPKLLYDGSESNVLHLKKNRSNMVGIILSYVNTKVAITSVISCEWFLFSLRKKRTRPDFAPRLPATTCISPAGAEQRSQPARLRSAAVGACMALTLPLGESKASRVLFIDRLDPIHMVRGAWAQCVPS